MSTEYYVKRVDVEVWEVAKFEGSEAPTAIYRIVKDVKNHLRCSCPRWLRKATTSCKHIEMVKAEERRLGRHYQ